MSPLSAPVREFIFFFFLPRLPLRLPLLLLALSADQLGSRRARPIKQKNDSIKNTRDWHFLNFFSDVRRIFVNLSRSAAGKAYLLRAADFGPCRRARRAVCVSLSFGGKRKKVKLAIWGYVPVGTRRGWMWRRDCREGISSTSIINMFTIRSFRA